MCLRALFFFKAAVQGAHSHHAMNAHLCPACSRFPGGSKAGQSEAQAEGRSEKGLVPGFPAALASEEGEGAPRRARLQPHQDLPTSESNKTAGRRRF